MNITLNPYLNFRDNALQAMEFYHTVFGGTLETHTFKEFHASTEPSEDNLIMHSVLQADNGLTFMASDTPARMERVVGDTISISLNGDNEQTLTHYFDKLSEGGQVTMPLEKAVWGDTFGMCTDKFGIHWMVSIAEPKKSLT